jgi:hypothetical protein
VIRRLILEVLFQDVGDLDPRLFALAAHDDVDIGLLAALLGQHAHMRPAQHDQAVVGILDLVRSAPRLLHLGRVGGNADQVGLVLLHELGDGLRLDICVENHHLIAAAFAYGGQVSQPQVRGRARVDGQTKSWVDQCNSHVLFLLQTHSMSKLLLILSRNRDAHKLL